MRLGIGERWRVPILLGLFTSLLQLGLCFIASGQESLAETYESFSNWDGKWYESIAKNGYVTSIPPERLRPETSNVAFFPGFPLLASSVAKLVPISEATSLAVTSQLAAIAFWILFYRALWIWTPSISILLMAGSAVVLHPTAFYLQMGYSESLFLSSLMGFLLALQTRFRYRLVLASTLGVMMTGTRIVGVPLCFLGVVAPFLSLGIPKLKPAAIRSILAQLTVAFMSLVGVIAFVSYCWYRWGHADLYMWTQERGWNIRPNYLAIINWSAWVHWPDVQTSPWKVDANEFSRFMTSLYLWLLMGTFGLELWSFRKGVKGLKKRLPFYVASVLMMFVSVSGLESVKFQSMSRYTFPVHAALVIGLSHLSVLVFKARPKAKTEIPLGVRIAFGALAFSLGLCSLVIQLRFIQMFTTFSWVA